MPPFLVRPTLAAVALLLLALPGRAEDQGKAWMSEDELKTALTGQAVEGEYPNGRSFKETYAAGGRVSYADELRSSGGRWSIEAGTFCTIYDDDPTGGCFRVHKAGPNCYEFYFVARTEEQARKDPKEPDWTARAWIEEQPSTCKERISA